MKAFDKWTWVHLASGLGLAVFGVPVLAAVYILVMFEVIEALISRNGGAGLTEPETRINVAVDIAAGLAGFLAVHLWLNRKGRA